MCLFLAQACESFQAELVSVKHVFAQVVYEVRRREGEGGEREKRERRFEDLIWTKRFNGDE